MYPTYDVGAKYSKAAYQCKQVHFQGSVQHTEILKGGYTRDKMLSLGTIFIVRKVVLDFLDPPLRKDIFIT